MYVEDSPAWDVLCRYLHGLQMASLNAPESQQRAIWQLRMKCRGLYDHAVYPDVMAAKMLAILTKPQRHQAAA